MKLTMFYLIVQKQIPPIEAVDEAAQILKDSGANGVVAVGGGSSIDTSKAMSMLVTNEGSVRDYLFGGTKEVINRPLPLIAIPTTAGSGSEVTAASVITDNQNDIKLSVTHEYLMPLGSDHRSGYAYRNAAYDHGKYRYGCTDTCD